MGCTQVAFVSRLNTAGLPVHEVETYKSSAELLGAHLDVEQHKTRITNARYWKARLGTQGMATPKFVDHQTLHVFRTCTTGCSGDLPRYLLCHPKECVTLARKCGPRCAGSWTFSVVSCLTYSSLARYSPTTQVKKLGVWSRRRGAPCGRKLAFVASMQYLPALTHLVTDAVVAAPSRLRLWGTSVLGTGRPIFRDLAYSIARVFVDDTLFGALATSAGYS